MERGDDVRTDFSESGTNEVLLVAALLVASMASAATRISVTLVDGGKGAGGDDGLLFSIPSVEFK